MAQAVRRDLFFRPQSAATWRNEAPLNTKDSACEISMASGLVAEVAVPRRHHRHAVLIGRGDDLVVALAAARLDHGRGAGLRTDDETIGEREERVARDDCTARPFAGLVDRDLGRIDALMARVALDWAGVR